jgi:hypothetical protein
MSRARIDVSLARMRAARHFTSQFLNDVGPEEWFWHPPGLVTHVAWQIGHLAAAQYMLCLQRLRGARDADQFLISEDFLARFGRGSTPASGAQNNPPQEEIRRVFNGVFEQSLAELADPSDADLDVPLPQPHPAFRTKLEAVEFCPMHEMVHAGQIALLRRLMGKPPLR